MRESLSVLISVILPVRNPDLLLLSRAIESVLAQTYESFEILLIDDGSESCFREALKETAKKDKRIRLFHCEGKGVSAARNFAVTKALGEVITYLDADDAISSVCFEEAVHVLADRDIEAVWGGTCYVEAKNFDKTIEKERRKPLSAAELKKLTLKPGKTRIHKTRSECLAEPFRFGRRGYINRGIAARFIRKELFNDKALLFPEGIRMYEDTIWNLRMMEKKICYVKTIWYYYMNNENSASNRYNENVLNDIELPLKRIRRMTDTDNHTEYKAYTRFLMDSLRYVYKCLYGHPLWKPDKITQNKALRHICKEKPWSEIGSKRFFDTAERSDKLKSILYRTGLLFAYWKLRWKKM